MQSNKRLAQFHAVSCPTDGCAKCIQMCEGKPCWPSPDDTERLIAAGLGDRLMLDWWVGSPDILLLSPAIAGCEGDVAPGDPHGRCTFLVEGKCALHDRDLKPWEGRVADCRLDDEPSLTGGMGLHEAVAQAWNTNAARQLVATWCDEHEVDPDDRDDYTPLGLFGRFL